MSGEYDVFSKSFVQVGLDKIELIKNSKSLHDSQNRYFNLEQLKIMSNIFNMNLIKDEYLHSLTVKGHYHGFEISEDDHLIVIYSLEGTKAPEYMFIYGVWKK
ncbi:hypothetical protein BZARG_3071 [Bizionia argentinensis JUB59]|uniref:Uncharacterized protein n=1 Tax=Bizionia argentinensis JUB59 TaxID=1046627 RepID=G2EEP8_9FLAO|nr:hypothetical protein BZARG_3071 [Bizionia argentinensis JUB59]